MAIDYTVLKTEILSTDPALVALMNAGRHQDVANALNTPKPAISIRRGIVESHELWEAINAGEYAALTATERQRLQTILGMGRVNLKGDNTRAALALMFGPGTTTRTNILALIDRQGSRAEQLFGVDARVSASDIAIALLA